MSMGTLAAWVLALAAAGPVVAQTGDDLGVQGEQLDARLFAAYNACDLEAFGDLLAEDIEFFHDKGGLMTGRQVVVDAVQANICGKVRRELVPSTLASFPMDGYGMVQLGAHRFCTIDTGTCTGSGRFVHLWQRQGDRWRATRIISYDHQPL